MRVNPIGELGYEIHHPIEMQNDIFDRLMAAGAAFGIKPFGVRAMDSLRLEKSYKPIPRELSIEDAALESGLDRFVGLDKGDVLGRAAPMAGARAGLRQPRLDAADRGRDGRRCAGLGARAASRRARRTHDIGRLRRVHGAEPRPPMVRPDLGEVGTGTRHRGAGPHPPRGRDPRQPLRRRPYGVAVVRRRTCGAGHCAVQPVTDGEWRGGCPVRRRPSTRR